MMPDRFGGVEVVEDTKGWSFTAANYQAPACISTPQSHKMKIPLPNRTLAACTLGTVGLGSKVRRCNKPAHRMVV